MLTKLFVAAALLACVAAPAHASEVRTCEGLFSGGRPTATAKAITLARITELRALKDRLLAPAFQIAKYDQALDGYRAAGPNELKQPKSREEKLALLTYVTKLDGRNPYDLEVLARSGGPRALARLVKTFGKIDATSFSPTQIDFIFERLKAYAEPNPYTLKILWREGFEGTRKIALQQWATKEIASHNAQEAFERLGLLEDARGMKAWRDALRANPNVQHAIASTSFNVFLMMTGGLPLSAPSHSRLEVTRLDPELRTLIETEGFDASYPVLKERYGKLANFDHAFFWARRAAAAGMMTYMLCAVYPSMMHSLAPLLTDDKDGVLKMTGIVLSFYVRMARDYVERQFAARQRSATLPLLTNQPTQVISRPTLPTDKPQAPHAVPVVDDSKPLAKPMTVTTFDDAMKADPIPHSKAVGDSPEDKALQQVSDGLDNISIDDPTEH